MPRESYEELLTPVNEDTTGTVEQKDIEYDGKSMEAVVKLLEFLENRLEVVSIRFSLHLLIGLLL